MALKYRILVAITTVVLVSDQWSKLWIDHHFRLYESVMVIEDFFHITYVRNKGAAFGILADSPFRIPFFMTVSLLAVGAIFWYISRLEPGKKLAPVALSLIFSGAIGNLIDRVRLGEVIDFLDVHWYQYHWPAFNVADSAITVGVALLMIDLWRDEHGKKTGQASNRAEESSKS